MITGLQGRLVPFYIHEPHLPEALTPLDAGAEMLVNSLSGPKDRAENRAGNGRVTLSPAPTSRSYTD
jgi:hypothetical protein